MGSYVQVAGNFRESRELMLRLQGKRARGRKRNADFAKDPAYLGACEEKRSSQSQSLALHPTYKVLDTNNMNIASQLSIDADPLPLHFMRAIYRPKTVLHHGSRPFVQTLSTI